MEINVNLTPEDHGSLIGFNNAILHGPRMRTMERKPHLGPIDSKFLDAWNLNLMC